MFFLSRRKLESARCCILDTPRDRTFSSAETCLLLSVLNKGCAHEVEPQAASAWSGLPCFFQAQLEGQREEGREGELGGATESASAADGNEVEDTGSDISAAWESELEEGDDADAGEN